MKDPFGTRPRPVTGRRRPHPADDAASRRASAATILLREIWIEHRPQRMIINELRKYRNDTLGCRGVPLTGRRLSQASQAGKSRTMNRLKVELAREREASGLPPNEYQVVIVELDQRTTVKQFYQEVLKALDDEFWNENVSAKLLEQRIADFVIRLDVELLIADEVQHLRRRTTDASEVTDKLKVFCDRGIAAMVLVGDEDSVEFFRENSKLAVRLGRKLELPALDPKRSSADAKLFKSFCMDLDKAIVDNGIFCELSGLASDAMLDSLLAVSGGHVGRVARLVETALPDAVWRGAEKIEAYDLSNATRDFAIENDWIDFDPFSTCDAH